MGAVLLGGAHRREPVYSVLGSGSGRSKERGCVQVQSEPKRGLCEAGWCYSGSATAELDHARRRNGVEHRPGLRYGPRTLGSSAVGREGATSAHRGFVSSRDAVQCHRCRSPAASHGQSAMTGSLGWSSCLLVLSVRLLAVLWQCFLGLDWLEIRRRRRITAGTNLPAAA